MTEISFENLSEEARRKIQQIQLYEQTFQQILMEKKALLLEIEELESALHELNNEKREVFKIVAGQYIFKSSSDEIIKEINHKKEIFSLRIKNLEKQEKEYFDKMEKLREEIIKEINTQDYKKV